MIHPFIAFQGGLSSQFLDLLAYGGYKFVGFVEPAIERGLELIRGLYQCHYHPCRWPAWLRTHPLSPRLRLYLPVNRFLPGKLYFHFGCFRSANRLVSPYPAPLSSINGAPRRVRNSCCSQPVPAFETDHLPLSRRCEPGLLHGHPDTGVTRNVAHTDTLRVDMSSGLGLDMDAVHSRNPILVETDL